MTSPRSSIPQVVVNRVLIESRRRCCLCFFWNDDHTQKAGQIAHIDRDRANNAEDNLAYLCFDHHNQYDARQIQGKNITVGELQEAKRRLIQHVETKDNPHVLVSVELDEDFDTFTNDDQQGVAKIIKTALESEYEIRVRGRRRGSVILSIEMNASDAIRLSDLLDSGDARLSGIQSVVVDDILDHPDRKPTGDIISHAARDYTRKSLRTRLGGRKEFVRELEHFTTMQLHALVLMAADDLTVEDLQVIHDVALSRLADEHPDPNVEFLLMDCKARMRR